MNNSKQLRNRPESLSIKEFTAMLKKHGFFDYDWNNGGQGFNNQFEEQTFNDVLVVFDKTSNLIWQHDGSSEKMNLEKAKKWVEELNHKGYAGFNDWRLPTLVEAVSLLNPKAKSLDLFIDPIFDKRQWGVWTSDLTEDNSRAWTVSYSLGGCSSFSFHNTNFVRAVRSL